MSRGVAVLFIYTAEGKTLSQDFVEDPAYDIDPWEARRLSDGTTGRETTS